MASRRRIPQTDANTFLTAPMQEEVDVQVQAAIAQQQVVVPQQQPVVEPVVDQVPQVGLFFTSADKSGAVIPSEGDVNRMQYACRCGRKCVTSFSDMELTGWVRTFHQSLSQKEKRAVLLVILQSGCVPAYEEYIERSDRHGKRKRRPRGDAPQRVSLHYRLHNHEVCREFFRKVVGVSERSLVLQAGFIRENPFTMIPPADRRGGSRKMSEKRRSRLQIKDGEGDDAAVAGQLHVDRVE